MTTEAQTTTRKAHDLKPGDIVRIDATLYEVFDNYPIGGDYLLKVIGLGLAYNRGVMATIVPVDADIETR